MKITKAHGAGGQATAALIDDIFAAAFGGEVLRRMEDAAVVPGQGTLALTTDSFVVTPLVFPGGDIGRLAVCGTVNDLAMSGATPRYLTCGFILEEGLEIELLRQLVRSMAATAREAGVEIVAGDTKVVEGSGGLYINTAGVGFVPEGVTLGARFCRQGDVVLLSGALGDHHAAILSRRMGIENTIRSDCAPLNQPVRALLEAGVQVRALRDVTRGGLATVLCEMSRACGCGILLEETQLPVREQVRGFCGILGLDPLYMGNEGKFVAVVAPEDAPRALQLLREQPVSAEAVQVGRVAGSRPQVVLHTELGGRVLLEPLQGEGLPRIC